MKLNTENPFLHKIKMSCIKNVVLIIFMEVYYTDKWLWIFEINKKKFIFFGESI